MTETEQTGAPNPKKFLNREDLLAVSSSVISDTLKKQKEGRIRDQENERLRQGLTRILLEGLKVHASILRDEQYDLLVARLRALEERGNG